MHTLKDYIKTYDAQSDVNNEFSVLRQEMFFTEDLTGLYKTSRLRFYLFLTLCLMLCVPAVSLMIALTVFNAIVKVVLIITLAPIWLVFRIVSE